MKKAGKFMIAFIISLISLLIILFAVWAIMSPGKIRTYNGEKSVSEKFVMEINGAPNGFL